MNTTNRRDFLRTLGLSGMALAASLSGISYAGSGQKRIQVAEDMTANMVMDYIANQAGIDLGKNVTDDATNYLTVELGKKLLKEVLLQH